MSQTCDPAGPDPCPELPPPGLPAPLPPLEAATARDLP